MKVRHFEVEFGECYGVRYEVQWLINGQLCSETLWWFGKSVRRDDKSWEGELERTVVNWTLS